MMWKIEADLQLSKQKVADYGPVNNLLMIREGEKAGLSHAEIAAAMYGWTEEQVAIDLERLNLMDNFLQFMGQPNNHGLIKRHGLAEYFQDIQKTVLKAARREGVPKREIQRRLEFAFLLLRASIDWGTGSNFTHWDMRKVGAILSDFEANAALTEGIRKDSAIFPIELPSWFMRLFTKKNDIVLDPFVGSGTTAVAAIMNHRRYVGVELNSEYFKEVR